MPTLTFSVCRPFFDGFANVVSEAVAMGGIPVACSEFAGSNEIITDGKNGYVFSEVEPIKISEAIINAYKIGIGDFSDSVCSDEEVFDKYIDLCSKPFNESISDSALPNRRCSAFDSHPPP